MQRHGTTFTAVTLCALGLCIHPAASAWANAAHDAGGFGHGAHDPGVRGAEAGAGAPLAGLDSYALAYFKAAEALFITPEGVGDGLGPRFNLDSCAGCHAQPAVGGTSPAVNPQLAIARAYGARNAVPSFLSINGPIREARFKNNADGSADGGVHALFVISSRVDFNGSAATCNIAQDDFAANLAHNNVSLRIPTPTFGNGLMEAIDTSTLNTNLAANPQLKSRLGIGGHFNHNGNTGTVTRFGWKAQNSSALVFAGEAYNVEMGISNNLFPTEREEAPGCGPDASPNSDTIMNATSGINSLSSTEMVGIFVRFLAPPVPSTLAPGGGASIAHGRAVFAAVGCALCHTPSLRTSNSNIAALRNQDANLYSDLALHHMGPRLADDIEQGGAAGDEFRSAPLWGLGQRLFFLHDGRSRDLAQTIELHASRGDFKYTASEANAVVALYENLPANDAQDLLNFLRSL